TLDYPARFGPSLAEDIRTWGENLRQGLVEQIADLFPGSPLAGDELQALRDHLKDHSTLVDQYKQEELDAFLFVRQVTCPHCEGEAPLLNGCWLSKEGEQWGVKIVTDGKPRGGKVRFETYRVGDGRGPDGEDPETAYIQQGDGTCVHCRQAID